jgi:hypothetical protein
MTSMIKTIFFIQTLLIVYAPVLHDNNNSWGGFVKLKHPETHHIKMGKEWGEVANKNKNTG